ncbi:hypothetical protein [Absidia glauca]|uniref:Uncharacterized protein n=1 Tax=Absidia glauca TaxID=4829 RepID=A0A163KGC4_ABSGL|nr:hypothetical protein [Absidia glauca]
MEASKWYDIDVVESGITSPKTASFDRLIQHIRIKMAVLDQLLMIYVKIFNSYVFSTTMVVKKQLTKCFDVHQSRWKPDGSKKQRHQPSTETKSNKWKKIAFDQPIKTPLLCIEDGQFERKTFRGKPSGLANAFKKPSNKHNDNTFFLPPM